MERVRVGVIGAGGVAQVEHIPNLVWLRDLFDLVGVADPSPTARNFVAGRYGVPVYPDAEGLIAAGLDAVVIASPDPLHLGHVLLALGAGLHVFCEKPLTYAASDIAALASARDSAARVLQVGYMKRFDPSYEALLALLPSQSAPLRQISVEVTDPDAGPFVQHHRWQTGSDLPSSAGDALKALQAEQVNRAVPGGLADLAYRGFCSAYSSSLVHDVNAVHGMLDVLGIPDGTVVGAAVFAGALGGQGAVSLLDGAALWTMSHLTVRGLPHYSERITLTFEDASLELEFPSPYLNHLPTRLTERRGRDGGLQTRTLRTSYAEAFIEELRGFHRAITQGEAVRNTAEHAARDMALLSRLAAKATANPDQSKGARA